MLVSRLSRGIMSRVPVSVSVGGARASLFPNKLPFYEIKVMQSTADDPSGARTYGASPEDLITLPSAQWNLTELVTNCLVIISRGGYRCIYLSVPTKKPCSSVTSCFTFAYIYYLTYICNWEFSFHRNSRNYFILEEIILLFVHIFRSMSKLWVYASWSHWIRMKSHVFNFIFRITVQNIHILHVHQRTTGDC